MEVNKPLSTFGLIMINVIAICSLRTLPFGAEFGSHLIIIYFIAFIGFMLPIAYIASFLATRYPKTGGVYIWVKSALGTNMGFRVVWLQWLFNLLWYPTAMIFVAKTLLSALAVDVSTQAMLVLTTAIFWLITLANCFGLRVSAIISIVGAVVGTIMPMLLLIGLTINHHDFVLPEHTVTHTMSVLPLVVNILFGLMGIEMSCVHAGDVNKPQQSYPKALLIASCIIVVLLVLASLAIAAIVSHEKISILSGVSQAFSIILTRSGLNAFTPLVLSAIAVGSMACIGAWIIGPSKGLFVAADDGCLPSLFARTNKHEVPQPLLIMQAILVSLLNVFYLLMPSIEVAYETLSIASSQLALLAYIFIVAAAWRLRNSTLPGYELPGGRISYKIACIISMILLLLVFIVGFKVPPSLTIDNSSYSFWLMFSMLIILLPTFCLRNKL